MKLNILGFNGGYPGPKIGTSGYLISSDGFNLLIDCGSGIMSKLEQEIDPFDLNAVILSHYHADHIADVGVLQHYWQILYDQRKYNDFLPIYGHKDDLSNFNKLDWFNFTKKHSYNEKTELFIGPFKITFKKVIHPVSSYAIRVEEVRTKKVLTYTSDTKFFPELIDFCKNSDLLITDTNFGSDKKGELVHMTSKESGILANESNSKKLIISHLPQTYNLNNLLEETESNINKNIKVLLPDINQEYYI
ncbi:MBL fold metallo-hydrolase [Lactobacillus sp. S2-2]|uniref:MBL fold metallo-hydrolase n=1 Tax=Lactobacillus sp. S2-2 TaxID=2692917 RepID=UPI001F38A3CA|nr:MBL fold metallo-hydrolase [Lactobacillus sp. S2-2]MCF6514838.1 MBL fold metallo-hydrolase [Lactobacillus sp. S2-2]